MTLYKFNLFYGIAISIYLATHISTVDTDRASELALLKDCLSNNRCIVQKIQIGIDPSPDLNSCAGQCAKPFNLFLNCHCDTECAVNGDCCTDYADQCGGSTITNDELQLIGNSIWNADADRLTVDINLQNRTVVNGTDKTTDPLFTSIPEGVTTNPMYVKFTKLAQNYNRNQSFPENFNSTQWQQVDDFLTEVTKSQSMVVVQKFLAAKGNASSNMTVFQSTLRDIWFTMYNRCNSCTGNSSSGFEHVMVGEVQSPQNISGFHNWVRFALLEKTNNVAYLGYIKTVNLTDNAIIISNPFYWDSYYKPVGSFFIGTSPAFDMAVFTLCFYARPNAICNLNINSNSVPIQTYTSNCSLGNAGCVASSFPNLLTKPPTL